MPELKPSLDSDFLAPGPLLRWLAETLEAAEEASHGQLQLAALECAEKSNFAIDGDLELAGSLLAGHEGRESSINQALNAQLKRDIEQFAQNFFRHDLESRQFLFEELRKRCVENSTLADRLGLLERGLQIDTAALVELEGDVAHLAELALELFVLPQPKQSRVRRERLREIFAKTEGGAFADAPEWRGVVKLLRILQPQLASLDEALMQHLTWSPGGKKRAKKLSHTFYWLNKEIGLLQALTAGPTLTLFGIIIAYFTFFVDHSRNGPNHIRSDWQPPAFSRNTDPEWGKQAAIDFANLQVAIELVEDHGRDETLALLDRLLALPPGTPDVPSVEQLNGIKSAVERIAPLSDAESIEAPQETPE